MKSKTGRTVLRPKRARRPLGVAATAIALAGFTGGLAVSSAAAATVRTGTLALSPAKATAGDTADVFTFTYTAPAKPSPGTISIGLPAGFSPPQNSSASGRGYLSVSSACAQFQVTGVTADGTGGNVVTVAENCAAGLKATLIYSQVTVPTTAQDYPVATSFTPPGGTAVAFANQHIVTVKPGALASVTVTPATATIAPGGTQAYTASGFDAYGNALGPIAGAKFTIKPNGSCTGATCTATAAGPHTVTATSKKISGTATLTVAASPDLAVTEQVSNTLPHYYTPLSFTTTVTNLSTTTASNGVSVTVAAPAALISPSVTASAGSYNGTSTWTIGTLAPGASATLTIAGFAGDVDAGLQTVTATLTSTTPDPNSANNTASASEKSQPADLGVKITPDAGDPPLNDVDVSGTGNIGFTGSAYNVENPSAPAPAVNDFWTCSSLSGNPCPDNPALTAPSPAHISFPISSFSGAIDTWTLTFQVTAANDNYSAGSQAFATVSFTTINSGG
jgi:hypothetical protein